MAENRFERRAERLGRMADTRAAGRVRVNPRDDVIRRDIKHGNIRFPAEGSVEWPLDQYTKRRLRDGTVTLETESEKSARNEQRAQDRRYVAPQEGKPEGKPEDRRIKPEANKES